MNHQAERKGHWLDALTVNNNIPEALIGPFNLSWKDWQICEYGSDSPCARLFGRRLHRGGTCTANQVGQGVGYLLFCMTSKFTCDQYEIKPLQQRRPHIRQDWSRQIKKNRLKKKECFLVDKVFGQLFRDNGVVCFWLVLFAVVSSFAVDSALPNILYRTKYSPTRPWSDPTLPSWGAQA